MENNKQVNSQSIILIIDDDQVTRNLIKVSFKPADYLILEAASGPEGIEIAEKKNPHLIILDIMMPKVDGYETYHKLKGNERTRNIPIIFLTGKTATEDQIKGLELGSLDYLTKPINFSLLIPKVKTFITLRKNELELTEKNRELEGLYQLTNLNIEAHDLEEVFLLFTKNFIHPFMKYPDKVLTEIKFDDILYYKADHLSKKDSTLSKLTNNYISEPLIVDEQERGQLIIGYREEDIIFTFEKRLIKSYASTLSKIIKQREKEAEIIESGEVLRGRVKELESLNVFTDVLNLDLSLEETFNKLTAELIPQSMYFTKKVFCEIILDNKSYSRSENISKKTNMKLSAPLQIKGEQRGELIVGHTDKYLVFKTEYEQKLINSFAEKLSRFIEKKETSS